MREYTFDKSKLRIKFNGIEFVIDTGHKDVSQALRDFSHTITSAKTITDVINICTIAINDILQDEKAVDDIFASRNITVDELIDLVEYMSTEIGTFKTKRLAKYIDIKEEIPHA